MSVSQKNESELLVIIDAEILMKRIKDQNCVIIGSLDGDVIRDGDGVVLYRIMDNDLFAPCKYEGDDLIHMNKGQMISIGEIVGHRAVSKDGELLFEIEPVNNSV